MKRNRTEANRGNKRPQTMVQTISDSWKRLHTRKLLRKKQQQHKNCADHSLASPEVSQSHASHQTPNSSKTPSQQTPQNTSKNKIKQQTLKNRTNNNNLSKSSIPSTSHQMQNNEKLNPKVKLFYKPQPPLKDRHVSIFSITTSPWPTKIAIKHQKYKSTGKKPHRTTPLHKHQEHEQEVRNQTLNCDTDQT